MRNYLKRLKNSEYLSGTFFLTLLILIGLCSNKSIKSTQDYLIISAIFTSILWLIFLLSHIKIKKS